MPHHDDRFMAMLYSIDYLNQVQKQIESMQQDIAEMRCREMMKRYKYDPFISKLPMFMIRVPKCFHVDLDVLEKVCEPGYVGPDLRSHLIRTMKDTLDHIVDPLKGLTEGYMFLSDRLEKISNFKVRNALSMKRREELEIDRRN